MKAKTIRQRWRTTPEGGTVILNADNTRTVFTDTNLQRGGEVAGSWKPKGGVYDGRETAFSFFFKHFFDFRTKKYNYYHTETKKINYTKMSAKAKQRQKKKKKVRIVKK